MHLLLNKSMEISLSCPSSNPACHSQTHRLHHLLHGLPHDNQKDLERFFGELGEDKDMQPFLKIDEETIQHFSHDHQLILHGNNENSCDHHDQNKFCQACCLQLITPQRYYGCMQCDFVLHEACACLPCQKHHPLHKHPLTLHSFPLKPKFDAYVKGMFACDGCEQLNCGFMYKCDKERCEFRLDVRCASLSHPLVRETYHHHHSLFFTKTRGICMSCKSSKCSRYLLECRQCNFVVGLKCATLPSVAHYKHDKHPLTLCYSEESTRNLEYFCEKCDLGIDEKTWFYSCDSCEVKLHVRCLLGRDIYMKPNHIISINDEEVQIVRNDGGCSHQVVCYVCGKPCVDTLIFKWQDRYSCTFLCIVTFFL